MIATTLAAADWGLDVTIFVCEQVLGLAWETQGAVRFLRKCLA